MHLVRTTAVLGMVGLFLTQAACPLEPDPQLIEDCKPLDVMCVGDDRVRYCTEEGLWGPNETFVCVGGECQIMGGVAVCM